MYPHFGIRPECTHKFTAIALSVSQLVSQSALSDCSGEGGRGFANSSLNWFNIKAISCGNVWLIGLSRLERDSRLSSGLSIDSGNSNDRIVND
uniref:Secreted protein n=1 Tax=Rodentolepis nana TaxID=102285 RepID=A0A0R3TCG9_RODNA